jgi:hypothetical protein
MLTECRCVEWCSCPWSQGEETGKLTCRGGAGNSRFMLHLGVLTERGKKDHVLRGAATLFYIRKNAHFRTRAALSVTAWAEDQPSAKHQKETAFTERSVCSRMLQLLMCSAGGGDLEDMLHKFAVCEHCRNWQNMQRCMHALLQS